MAALWEQLMGAAIDSTDPAKAVDFAGAYQKGAALAQQKQALMHKQEELKQKAAENEMQKFSKVGEWMDTYNKMAEGPAKKVFGDKFITSGIKALGLEEKIHPLNQEMMIKDSRLAGAITKGIRDGKYDISILGDPDKMSQAYPELVKDNAAEDVAALTGTYRETFDKAEAERGQRAATKENAQIVAQGQAQRAIDEDNRKPDVEEGKKVSALYTEWTKEGGDAGAASRIKKLTDARNKLKNKEVILGDWKTQLPYGTDPAVTSRINKKVKALSDDVQSTLNVKLLTGDPNPTAQQVGDVRGFALDGRLDNDANIAKIDAQIEKEKRAQQNLNKLFIKHRKIKGGLSQMSAEQKARFDKLPKAEQDKVLKQLGGE